MKRWTSLCFLLIAIFLTSRLIRLGNMPIFTDEAFDITLGREVREGHVLAPLDKGYLPVYFWINSLFFNLPLDPILAGRLTGVGFGLGSLLVILALAKKLFSSSRAALWSGVLFLTSPMFLFYQRQAILDSAVLFFSLAIAYCIVLTVKNPSGLAKILLAISVLLGFLTKTTVIFSLPLAFLSVFLTSQGRVKTAIDVLLPIGVTGALVILLFMTPAFSRVREHHLVLSRINPSIVWDNSLTRFRDQTRAILSWILSYLTWPLGLLTATATGHAILTRNRAKVVLIGWFLASLFLLTGWSNSPYPRYTITLFVPLYLLLAGAFSELSQRQQLWTGLTIIPAVAFCAQILFNLPDAPLPPLERWQYLEGWTSGNGLREIREKILDESAGKKPTLYVEDSTYQSASLTMGDDIRLGVFANMRSPNASPIAQLPSDGYLLYNYWTPPESDQLEIIMSVSKSKSSRLVLVRKID